MDKKKVLIVDDEKDIREHVGSMLASSGFEVISSENGLDALKLAAENKPDLVLLDIFLPDIDGGEVANRLATNPSTSQIPIVFLTGLVTKQERKEPEKIGKNFVIAKPLLRSELLSTISKVLR
ncbi:MAG: response regulator [Candidatus Omnitrophica bacterium]|nr:response regulator [Candidatus Omnitrophota bacterium]